MRAPVSRTVPATGTCSPTVTVDRSSVLVRSSAVRPGACSEQPDRTDTLLSSLIDRSIPPVTAQVPSRVTSAPTDSRGALSAVPPTLDLEYTLPTGAAALGASSVALRIRNWPPIRAWPMSMRPRMSGRRPEGSSIRKTLASIIASPRSRASPVPKDSMRAPVRSSDPPMRAPISRTSPCAVNWCSSLTLPVTCMRSAWMDRSPWPSMTVSTHSSRPPISDSHSQIAECLDVLALVRSVPVTWARDRSRSRWIRTPLACRPGRAHPVSTSPDSRAPSARSGASKWHPSNRSGKGTSSPDRSTEPVIAACCSQMPRGSIWSRSSWQQRRSSAASTRRDELPSPHASARPAPAAASSSATPTSFM